MFGCHLKSKFCVAPFIRDYWVKDELGLLVLHKVNSENCEKESQIAQEYNIILIIQSVP